MKQAGTAAQPHPAARALSLVGAAVLAVILIGSPASAQIPSVNDTVGGAVGGVTGGGSTGEITSGPVEEVGGTVGETVDEVGGSLGDTITDTGGSVGDTVGGPAGDAIKDTTGAVGGVVKDTSGSTGEAVKDTTGAVGHALDGTTDPILGEDGKGGKDHGGKKDGQKDRQGTGNGKTGGDRTSVFGETAFGEGAFGFGTRVPAIDLGSQELAGGRVAAFAPEPLNLGALAEAAVEAVKKFAFPILLSFLVAAFMLIQDRVDRKDPKLALAAVDTDQEWLSFA